MPDYFTLPEFRALPDVGSTTKYPDARVEAVAAEVVGIIEREVGTSFIGRQVIEVHDGDGRGPLSLLEAYVLDSPAPTAVEDGSAVTDTILVRGGGLLYRYSGTTLVPWSAGAANITITYTKGYSATPPADIKQAAMRATRQRLISTDSGAGNGGRRTRLTTEAGTFDLAVAGKDAPFGIPEVDAVVMAWAEELSGFGFA